MSLIFTSIQSGQQVSGDIDLRQFSEIAAIQCPVITSGDLLLRGAFDTTSANFVRLLTASGDLRFPTGPGSRMVIPGDAFPHGAIQYARIETSVAQTDVRTFGLLVLR